MKIKLNPSIQKYSKASKQCFMLIFLFFLSQKLFCQQLRVNDLEYFETQGLNVFVFNNQYNGLFFDEKTAGIELIHHGVRTSTGGAVRLQNTPEQWDLVPMLVDRKVDKVKQSIEVTLKYKEFDFSSIVKVTAKDKGLLISVYLDKPLPEKLEGQAGFNLEFLPASYFEKTYLADGKPGIFPLYPASNTNIQSIDKKIPQFEGHTTFDDRGKREFIVPQPLASGKTMILAPEDPERFVKIQSPETDIMLFDGRNLGQNGWYIVRSLIPAKKSGKVLEWYLEANTIPNWKRSPNIGFSQVGYHPTQKKVAVIELDKNDTPLPSASLFQVTTAGTFVEKVKADVKPWGNFLRYHYLTFDFSSIKEAGIYFIKYGEQKTNTFPIDSQVYTNVWHPTLDVFFPVQMDHMLVNEAYRVWHGRPYMDDAIQAPTNHEHFDGYRMGATTDTKYKPYERIPGLDVGGWFDAGDFDIQTGSHCSTILNFVAAWEAFRLERDVTHIDQNARFVDIHRPDGKADLLQQIEHGALNLVAQVKNIGHPVRGIIVPHLHQYHHLGDAATETDNLPYNPQLKPYETDGKSSGTMDDRWVFTNRTSFLDYFTASTLAAANRSLKDYNKTLADECLTYAKKLWDENYNIKTNVNADTSAFGSRFRRSSEIGAALQLFISTKDSKYATRFNELIWEALDRGLPFNISAALQALPYMDNSYKNKLKPYIIKYKDYLLGLDKENPYGLPLVRSGWGSNSGVVNFSITNYHAHKAFPEIIDSEYVFKGLNYLFGCHPYSNISFVSSVGTRSKKISYGNNRADFSFIAGGIVPGLMLLKPDFLENKEDWPFFWGENEYVIDIGASYIFLANAVKDLVNKK